MIRMALVLALAACSSTQLDSKPIAHLRRVQEASVFPATAVMPPLLSDGSWALVVSELKDPRPSHVW